MFLRMGKKKKHVFTRGEGGKAREIQKKGGAIWGVSNDQMAARNWGETC